MLFKKFGCDNMLFFKILSVLVISTVLGLGGLFISDHWKDTEEKNHWEARYQTIKNNRITIKDNVQLLLLNK